MVIIVVGPPPETDRARGVLLGELLDLAAQLVGMVDDLLGDQVRIVDHLEVLVGDDEGDVVVVRDEVLHERVLDLELAAEHFAVHALHGMGPEGDVVLLLLLELLGHVVGVEQRDAAQHHAHDDYHHAVAEREYVTTQFHRESSFSKSLPLRVRGLSPVRRRYFFFVSCSVVMRRYSSGDCNTPTARSSSASSASECSMTPAV